jgi:hypothetical protein
VNAEVTHKHAFVFEYIATNMTLQPGGVPLTMPSQEWFRFKGLRAQVALMSIVRQWYSAAGLVTFHRTFLMAHHLIPKMNL